MNWRNVWEAIWGASASPDDPSRTPTPELKFDWLNDRTGRPASETVKHEPRPERPSTTRELPSTLRAELSNPQLTRPILFDPALRQYIAHRAGEPQFLSAEDECLWHSCRMAVLHHVLQTISQSPARENLALRGSLLLAAWFGDQARSPGDLDWVVLPTELGLDSPESIRLLNQIIVDLEGTVVREGLKIPPNSHVREDIWMYERAPGIRIILPWQFRDERINGSIQLDLVFGETLPTPPLQTSVSLPGFEPVTLLAAGPEQSLAWKLAWLMTDSYPMGKDLYDAVLLAEMFGVSADVFQATLAAADPYYARRQVQMDRGVVLGWSVEWADFIKEYPKVTGTASDWQERLAVALQPLFDQLAKTDS